MGSESPTRRPGRTGRHRVSSSSDGGTRAAPNATGPEQGRVHAFEQGVPAPPDRQAETPFWDIHAHILPGIDDGPSDMDASLAMLETAISRGITGVVATPHSLSVRQKGGPGVIVKGLGALKAAAKQRGLAIELAAGMEVRLMPDTAQMLTSGDFLTINGTSFTLIEFDYTQWADFSEDVLFEMSLSGFGSVLAHVERIDPLRERPDRVKRLIGRGAFAQITAASVLGEFGSRVKRFTEELLAQGLVHLVASDMHSPHGGRQPWPNGAYERLVEVVGEDAARILVYVNPARLVEGAEPAIAEPRPSKRPWWTWRRR